MKKVLIAGATGYLGKYISAELKAQSFYTKVLVRNSSKFEEYNIEVDEMIQAEVTNKDSLSNCCEGIDVVISSLGITTQKDGLTYMDVDYQANLNLLKEAKQAGVKKFIYVSVLNGNKLKNLRICEAKELFVEALQKSGLKFCIIRPNGFFCDMSEVYYMAKKGRIYLFGNGSIKSNPIHGEDLAKVCVNSINYEDKEIEIGGPETLTQNEIALIAFNVLGKSPKITYIPDCIRLMILSLAKLVLNKKTFGPIEFFMNVMVLEMIAPEYGKHTLKEHFEKLKNEKLLET
ncbi:MAG: SDR family oxidoreductase [Campylobacteraceae bacterium]|nr:SDR family oxidoreductase [Campylobacteraceae bacterium]